MDRLTKLAHFIPLPVTRDVRLLCGKDIQKIVRLHGVPLSIVSDRDTLFTSRFWKGLQEAMGTDLAMSTAYHPQTDGQTERVIKPNDGRYAASLCVGFRDELGGSPTIRGVLLQQQLPGAYRNDTL